MGQPHPLTGAPVGVPGYDGHRVLVHWHQPPAIQQNPQPPSASITQANKSDEDDDEDDGNDDRSLNHVNNILFFI